MRHVTLRQLRALLAIQAQGKITNAAKELGLTAPAITLQLKQLEEDAGVVLFDRTAQGMRPTAAGLAVIEAAQAIEERLRVLRDEIDAIRGARRGSLVVGAVSTAKYFAPQVVAGFMRDYPEVELKLFVGNRAQTIASLKDHRVDVALMGRPPRDVPVRAAAFGDHPLLIVAAPDHHLVGRRGVSARGGRARALHRPRAGLRHPDLVRAVPRRDPEPAGRSRHRDGLERDDQAGGDGRARRRLHLGPHRGARGRDRAARGARRRRPAGLAPVVRGRPQRPRRSPR